MTNNRAASILEFAAKNEIRLIDFRFTSTTGKFLHITLHSDSVTTDILTHGISCDSSLIQGWHDMHKSDVVLVPDLELGSSFLDPFAAQPTLCLICDIMEPRGCSSYEHSPRATTKRAMEFLRSTGIAERAFFSLEMEFFVLDDARFAVKENGAFFELDSSEGIYNSGRRYEYNNHAHREGSRNCYLTSQPSDSVNDIRAEILETLREVKVKPLMHHHEAASSQCRIGFYHGEALETSDSVQKCKYITRNVASSYGKSATFMPQPFKDYNGSGMHFHISLWKNEQNLFVPQDPGEEVSQLCKYYIGGIIKHRKALNAILNPLTNSYKRLANIDDAAYGPNHLLGNRLTTVRIPHCREGDSSGKRIEVNFPDAGTNPYIGTAALIMAGIAGIQEKLLPGAAVELEKSSEVSLSKSLEEALFALETDRQFLTQGGVFTNDQLDTYVKLLRDDSEEVSKHPVPIEFIKYYNV
ncbi:glutamine synthetase beta-grasp domain-containing protein [Neorickettsia sp. 179522]|uniref:glutamine synthetase beta-grasp domain-containing protein n=1 Tax=Neorickettsia sp. 179522 TaxID=1714371 RepID=UPI00079AC244|nr:glutamine synthetase beta-grasp domain-containing protein [Neorickettsia sp. 179522]KYH12453.1 glutamine synthetase [Neorickettsia sp. 179522]